MKKILIIITTAFVPYGGLSTVMMNYYRKIDKSDICINFASTNKLVSGELISELERNNSKYFCLGNRKKNLFKYVYNLQKILRGNNYDAVHINANSATAVVELFIAKMCGVKKRIIHIHNSKSEHIIIHQLMKPLFCCLYTDAVACSSKAGKWVFGDSSFLVLNNAIDTEKFSFDELKRKTLRKELQIEEKTFVIGHVGKINKQKNHEMLIDIFEAYHNINEDSVLLLVGDGELKEKIISKVKKAGLKDAVIFLGLTSEVHNYLCVMDCFVFPSLWEGLPLSLVEAQSSGLKCITSANVTQEANVTGKIIYMNTLENERDWANEIIKLRDYDRNEECFRNIELLRKNGYDVAINAKKLKKMYIQ